jgi:hypothetical protein
MKHEQDEQPDPAESATEVGHKPDEEELDDLSWAIVKLAGALMLVGIAVGLLWGK